MDRIADVDVEGWAELTGELVARRFTVRTMRYALLLAGVFVQEYDPDTDDPDERRLIAWEHEHRLPYSSRLETTSGTSSDIDGDSGS